MLTIQLRCQSCHPLNFISSALLGLLLLSTSSFCQQEQAGTSKLSNKQVSEAQAAGNPQPKSESTADAPRTLTKLLMRTKFEHHRFQTVVTLIEIVNGKNIPLEGRTVSQSSQYLDGKINPLESAKTDENGVVEFEYPSRKDKQPNTSLVFQFAGDTSHQRAEAKKKLK